MERYLIDTNIFIRHLRGYKPAADFLLKVNNVNPSVSYVTIAELIEGCKSKSHLKDVKKLKSSYFIDYGSPLINKLAIDIFGEFKLTKGISFIDSILAATSLENSYVLITENTKHFEFIPHVKILTPDYS